MINRKSMKKGNKYKFWEHYHKLVELSHEGNDVLLDRLNGHNSENEKERFYILANIPEKYFNFSFEQILLTLETKTDNHDSIDKLKKYYNSLDKVVEKGIGLYIHGEHGISKTTNSIIILKKAIDLYYRCFFWKSSDIIDFIKSSWKNEYRRIFYEYIINTVDFLVIDDVARLFIKYEEDEKVFVDRIFTKRDDMNLVTILTANQNLETSKNFFGESLYSNFKERLIDIPLYGKDYREKISDELINQLE
jgi:DNA replication protein DnaC